MKQAAWFDANDKFTSTGVAELSKAQDWWPLGPWFEPCSGHIFLIFFNEH